ncbi:MAG: hypothetical protein HRT68_08000, partial [Flavobacteriaceae bacterium]|nr:hypothetical protein [Flavobacteriaceae bacterium]
VFNSFNDEILKESFITSINKLNSVKVCLVCNSSSEFALERLIEIAEKCDNTDVVNVKRKKSLVYSIRVGARYMSNQFNFKYLGFIVGMDNTDILNTIKKYTIHLEAILKMNKIEKENSTKQTFYKSIFSITEYIERVTL